jgi:hypothetical protein
MTLKRNGAVKLTTEILPSKNNFNVAHQTLPNDLPKVVKTELDNGEMKLFDINGHLIRTITGQSIDMPFVADQMSELLLKMDSDGIDISNFLACIRSDVPFDLLEDIILSEPDDVNVQKVNDDIYTIRMEIPSEIAVPETEYVVNIADINKKLLLASRLYDEDGVIKQCMMYQYDDCILKGFRQEVHQELPDCEKATLLTFAEISNLNFNYLK